MIATGDGDGRSMFDGTTVLRSALTGDRRVAWRVAGKDRYLYRPGEVLVDSKYVDQLRATLREVGARRARPHCSESRDLQGVLGVQRWSLVGGSDCAPDVVAALRDGLSADERAQAVSLNHILAGAPVYRFGPGGPPHDDGPGPITGEARTRGGKGDGVRIAILDTGFVKASTTAHPLLAQDYQDDGDDKDALYDEAAHAILSVVAGHGTFIAGIIRQRAPGTILDPEVTLDDLLLVDEVELAHDIKRVALRTGRSGDTADIVNLSLAGPSEGGMPPMALARALTELRTSSQAVFVAAAGNDYEGAAAAGDPEQKMWPAAFGESEEYDHVVGVAAVDAKLQPAPFSNRGPWVQACANGVDVRSTYLEGSMATPAGPVKFPHATARWSGTSFATPRVVAAIAAEMTEAGQLTPRDALAKVLGAGQDVPGGFGKFID